MSASVPSQEASLATLLSLAWPVVLARATQSVVGFSDALMVAPLGEESLAAVTTGALNSFSVILLPMGTAFIIQSFAAQLRGRGELDAIPRYAWYGLGLALLAGVLAALVVPLLPWLLAHLDYAPRVREQMGAYLAIRLLSVAPAVGLEALGNWYGGLGRTKPAMVAGVVVMVANVLGCYLLIMPRCGLPGFGVAGSAVASVIASWLGFALIFGLFLRESWGPRGVLASLRGLHWRELARVLRFGFPNGVNWFLEFAAFALFINVVVGYLGTTVLAAFNVVIQLNSISFMPAFGLGSAGAILVGEAIGRRAHDEVWPVVRLTVKVACGFMGSVGFVYMFGSDWLMGMFQPQGIAGDALVEVGATMLAFSAVWQLFDAVGITLGEALRAAGDTTWCMAARIVLSWAVFTPLAWVGVRWLEGGVSAVMGAMILYLLLLAVTLAWRFRSGKWRSIQLVEPEAAWH